MNYFYKSNQKKNQIEYIIFLLVTFTFCTPIIASDDDSKIELAYRKAINFKNINSDSVLYYANTALNLSKESQNPKMEYKSLIFLTKSNIKAGKIGEAIINCLAAKKIVETNNFLSYKLEVLMCVGSAYQAIGLSSDALKFYLEAQNNKINTVNYKEKVDLDYFTGSAYADIKEFSKCNKYLQSSISQSVANDYLLGAFKSYILLSNIYDNLDSVNKYLDFANKVIQENPELSYEIVVLKNNQGLLNKAIGNLELSKTQYLEAINISKKNGFRDHLTVLYNNYAYLLMTESKHDSAKIVLEKSLLIAQEINSIDLQSSIYDSYSDYFSVIEDYQTAIAYKDSSIEKRNQYLEQQRIQETLFLSAVFETEQKEKEILKQKNEITRLWMIILAVLTFLVASTGLIVYFIQKFSLSKSRLETVEKGKTLEIADALIRGQDAERKRLAMDLHDGLGARLGALRFLVDGFFKSNKKYNEVSESIVNIHQNVRDLSHRMLPTQLEKHGVVLAIKNMASSINKSDKFTVEFDTNLKNRLSDKLEANVYYLIYELINNATRHSNGNTIAIQFYEHDDMLSLSVEDNGSEFRQKESSNGMGLKNIKARIEYLGGQLTIESNKSVTIFMIEIPNTSL